MTLIKLMGMALMTAAIVGTPVAFVHYASRYGQRAKFNPLSKYALPCWALVFGVAMLVGATHHQKQQQADNLKIVVKCGVVYGYYPTNPPSLNQRGRRGDPNNAMTLTVDGKNRLYPIPLDFKRVPVGTHACFKIQDGSNTKGAYATKILGLA